MEEINLDNYVDILNISYKDQYINTLDFLSAVNMFIRLDGCYADSEHDFKSGKILTPVKAIKYCLGQYTIAEKPNKEDICTAEKALEWMSKECKVESEQCSFRVAFYDVCKQTTFSLEIFQDVARIIPRFKGQIFKSDDYPNVLRGQLNSRAIFFLRLVERKQVSNQYGTSTLFVFEDENKNQFSWFSTKEINFAEDMFYKIKGTVKSRNVFGGKRRITLNRCVVL